MACRPIRSHSEGLLRHSGHLVAKDMDSSSYLDLKWAFRFSPGLWSLLTVSGFTFQCPPDLLFASTIVFET
jgi:hypothetical protein